MQLLWIIFVVAASSAGALITSPSPLLKSQRMFQAHFPLPKIKMVVNLLRLLHQQNPAGCAMKSLLSAPKRLSWVKYTIRGMYWLVRSSQLSHKLL